MKEREIAFQIYRETKDPDICSFDVEVLDFDRVITVKGTVYKEWRETFGGSYLGCKERIDELVEI
jgi:hypothetical protein